MGKLEMLNVLNKVAVSTQYREKAIYEASGRYQGWAYIRIKFRVLIPPLPFVKKYSPFHPNTIRLSLFDSCRAVLLHKSSLKES